MPGRGSTADPKTLGWLVPWAQMGEMVLLAPQVVAYRTLRMASSGWPPSARDRLEYSRMVSEKVEAVGQLTIAMLALSLGSSTALSGAIGSLHRQVLANHRRLSRR